MYTEDLAHAGKPGLGSLVLVILASGRINTATVVSGDVQRLPPLHIGVIVTSRYICCEMQTKLWKNYTNTVLS